MTRHAQLRAVQRFGRFLSREREATFIRAIQAGQATFVERLSCTRSRWRVVWDGEECDVVYQRRHQQRAAAIVTLWPTGRDPERGIKMGILCPELRGLEVGA